MISNTWAQEYPKFLPTLTPEAMFRAGIFGGAYFNNSFIFKKLHDVVPKEFLQNFSEQEIQELMLSKFNVKKNGYQVNCGFGYEGWFQRGWISQIDPYGWVNWYINFYYGRRCEDDQKQIGRWCSFVGRHSGVLRRTGDPKIVNHGFKTRQNMLHWAINSELI